jgi:hypothetical protein
MATSVVVNGALPSSGTTDYTYAGFGTPQCAIIIATGNTAADTTTDSFQFAFGFWSASDQAGMSFSASDNRTTGVTSRQQDVSNALPVVRIFSADSQVVYSFAAITDGIRASIASGSTGLNRLCAVILFKGLTAFKVGTWTQNGTTPVTVTTGFPVHGLFSFRAGLSGTAVTTQALPSIGVAWNGSGGLVQRAMMFGHSNNADPTIVNLVLRNDCFGGSYLGDGGVSDVKITISNFTSTGFDTVATTATTALMPYLAFQLDDQDDFFVGDFDAHTSVGTQALTGPGFSPQIAGFLTTAQTSFNNTETAPTGCFHFGVAGRTPAVSRAFIAMAQDNVDTSNDKSRITTNGLDYRSSTATDRGTAFVDSWDSGGITLDYTTAATAAYKTVFWALKQEAATTTYTLTAATLVPAGGNTYQPRVTYTF